MSIQIPAITAICTTLLLSQFSINAEAQTQAQFQPDCQFASSDTDGDGFGWENQRTCIVTDSTSVAVAPVCIDDDGDGYGWDGEGVCRIDVICYDTVPLGDGFGWDGSNSCEIAAYDVPFSELQVLKNEGRDSLLFGVEIQAASAVCDIENVVVEFVLFANGRAEQRQDGSTINFGLWSTGFEDSDGLLHLRGVSARRLIITPDSVSSVDGGRGVISDCVWQ